MINHISQSFLKDFIAYEQGTECGILLREKYVRDRLFDDPEDPGSKELGAYFEWKAFGNLPKNGIEPKPVMMASGKEPIASYRMADINALRVRGNPELGVPGLLGEMGLKIIEKGKRLTLGRFQGTIDLLVMVIDNRKFIQPDGEVIKWRKGDKFVIDVKYSGLLRESTSGWNKHGWKWTDLQKAYHGIQAKQYSMLTGKPFYFWVFESNNAQGTISDQQLFYVPVDDEMIELHKIQANHAFDKFVIMAKGNAFESRPSMRRCGKCPLRNECTFKHDYPHPVKIDL